MKFTFFSNLKKSANPRIKMIEVDFVIVYLGWKIDVTLFAKEYKATSNYNETVTNSRPHWEMPTSRPPAAPAGST